MMEIADSRHSEWTAGEITTRIEQVTQDRGIIANREILRGWRSYAWRRVDEYKIRRCKEKYGIGFELALFRIKYARGRKTIKRYRKCGAELPDKIDMTDPGNKA